jgi:cell division protein FtsW
MQDASSRFQFNPTARLVLINVVALMGIGLLMVYSASLSVNPDERFTQFNKQLVFVPAAVVAMLVAMRVSYRWLNRTPVAVALLAVSVGLLAAVLVLGRSDGRWFRLSFGPVDLSVQPSEIAKLCLIVFFAWFLSRPHVQVRWFRTTFLPLVAVLGLVCGLIALRDLGTAVLIGVVGSGLMLSGGVPWWHMMTLVPPVAGAAFALVIFFPYRLQRLTTYMDPWQDRQGAGYQITQSLIAIGSGGWLGLGLGNGMQKYFYLPEDTTDFIFSIICEELGLAGGALVILLFLSLALLGLHVVRGAADRFGSLLALGVVIWIGSQAAINIGVATAALPTKGIALPLVSYGGTGLMLTATALGLLMSVAARSPALAGEERAVEEAVRLPA